MLGTRSACLVNSSRAEEVHRWQKEEKRKKKKVRVHKKELWDPPLVSARAGFSRRCALYEKRTQRNEGTFSRLRCRRAAYIRAATLNLAKAISRTPVGVTKSLSLPNILHASRPDPVHRKQGRKGKRRNPGGVPASRVSSPPAPTDPHTRVARRWARNAFYVCAPCRNRYTL